MALPKDPKPPKIGSFIDRNQKKVIGGAIVLLLLAILGFCTTYISSCEQDIKMNHLTMSEAQASVDADINHAAIRNDLKVLDLKTQACNNGLDGKVDRAEVKAIEDRLERIQQGLDKLDDKTSKLYDYLLTNKVKK